MSLVSIPMTGRQMREWLPLANLMTYTDFSSRVQAGMNLDQFLGPGRTAVLLYELEPRSGHWVTVFERPGGVIECFDALGFVPDDELEFIPKNFRRESGQNHSWLLYLLQKSGRRVEYNEKPLQQDVPGVATCGRWCIWRLAHRNMSLPEFQRKFEGSKADEAVAELISSP